MQPKNEPNGGMTNRRKGIKGPDLSRRLPPLEVKLKRARNAPASAGSYSDTLRGIRLAVIQRRHPDTTLDQAQGDLVQETLVERLYATPSGSEEHHSSTVHRLAQGSFG
ncbi:unnamed protein product [Psylliodes chrysocephalus]|uniref:Uncharacterized protein n=1 Tax=Psylliodes chrysocephalus TaxID=3402493 RepID=A0A9P0GEQ9_9CUCU|nr:unnamed protein product [Psylliodes chrysocephala]